MSTTDTRLAHDCEQAITEVMLAAWAVPSTSSAPVEVPAWLLDTDDLVSAS